MLNNQRKSISKKMRFEVFKRDCFTCAYCGRKPPAVTLEADHIKPVSKGGKNRKDNLVTSCFDCNRGKGATELSAIPESLSDRAERIKEAESQLKAYRKIIDAHEERLESDTWDVVHELFGDNCNELRSDWFKSIRRFVDKIGREEACEAADIAYIKFNDKFDRWKYFCGICWNKLKGDKYA